MNPEIKKRWVEALRSGKYQQGRQFLAEAEEEEGIVKYCCLGVLCEVMGIERSLQDSRYYVYGGGPSGGRSCYYLPAEAVEQAGFTEQNPEVLVEISGRRDGLANLNDQGLSFNKIADIIEKQL